VVHPRGDLVVATGGRAFWILDDVTPLRQVDALLREGSLHLFRPRPAYRPHLAAADTGDAVFGRNPTSGALLHFYLPRKAPVTIEVVNAAGTLMRRLATADNPDRSTATIIDAKPGLSRITWDLRRTSIPLAGGAGGGPGQGRVEGHLAAPGMYTVKLTSSGTTVTAPLEVRAIPGVAATAAAYAEQERLLNLIEKDLLEYRELSLRMDSVRTQLTEAMKKLGDSVAVREANAYAAKLQMPADIYRHLSYVHARVNAVVPDVRPSHRDMYGMLHKDWESRRPTLQRTLRTDLDALNATLTRFGQPPIKP
jgi:hypothetical protein